MFRLNIKLKKKQDLIYIIKDNSYTSFASDASAITSIHPLKVAYKKRYSNKLYFNQKILTYNLK
jgi:hypothetical protein